MRRTSRTEVWSPSRRQGGAVEEPQSDAMDVGLTMEARPHAPPPCEGPRPARVAPWAAPHTAAHEPLSSSAVCEQRFGSPGRPDSGTELRALMDGGATGGCSVDGDSWATAQTPAQKQAESRTGALLPPEGMAVTDGAAQSAARSADARGVKATMQNVSTATSRPGQDGQSPPVTPSLPSLPSTPTRVQQPVEGAPAAADPTTGRGTRRGRDEDVPPAVARDTSGLDELPAPRDSKDASGHPYDNAASWVDDHVKKGKALPEQEQVTPSPNPSPSLNPNPNPNPNPNTNPNPRWRVRRLRRVRRRRR